MLHSPDRLVMEVSEPWDFGNQPVRLRVKECTSDERWKVTVASGWPQASEAVLAARYAGETLLPLGLGREVVVNLTSLGAVASTLIGTVRKDASA